MRGLSFIHRLVTDLLCVVFVFTFQCLYNKLVSPYEIYFTCSDQTIQYPHQKSSVSLMQLYAYFYCLPLIIIFIWEAVIFKWKDPNVKKGLYIFTLYNNFIILTFGTFMIQSIVSIMQKQTGFLRPYFLRVCDPEKICIDAIKNPDYENTEHHYNCEGDKEMISQARTSFPSFHAALSTHGSILMVFYIQAKLHYKEINLIKRTIQCFIFGCGLYSTVIRISEYQESGRDVAVGFILGVISAFYISFYTSDWFTIKTDTARLSHDRRLVTPPML